MGEGLACLDVAGVDDVGTVVSSVGADDGDLGGAVALLVDVDCQCGFGVLGLQALAFLQGLRGEGTAVGDVGLHQLFARMEIGSREREREGERQRVAMRVLSVIKVWNVHVCLLNKRCNSCQAASDSHDAG